MIEFGDRKIVANTDYYTDIIISFSTFCVEIHYFQNRDTPDIDVCLTDGRNYRIPFREVSKIEAMAISSGNKEAVELVLNKHLDYIKNRYEKEKDVLDSIH